MTTPYSGTPDNNAPYTEAPRDTDGIEYNHVLDAEAYYNAPVAEPAPTEAPKADNEPEAVVDDRPALEGVGPEYGSADTEPEGVDMTTLPEFKDMRRMLPSARLKVQMNTAKVATALPSHLKDANTDGGIDFDNMTADDLDALTNVIATVETTVLDNAADRDAMTDWLLAQSEPLNAVMAAFSKFTDRLGN